MTAIAASAGRRVSARQAFWTCPPVVAVLGAMLFNFALCFVNTMVGGAGNSAVIGCEVVIILAVLFYTFPSITYSRLLVIGSAVMFIVALAVVRTVLGGALDIKPARDFLIPVAFFLLGAFAGDLRTADRIVRVIVTIVIVVGAFEYFFPDVFTKFFNVAGFYMERGVMGAKDVAQSSNLFVSGMRPEGASGGRGLFPILGNHRVSSIFLEPVSAGNFGIVVFVWALVRTLMERRMFWGLFISAATVIIMSDSRFGANFCAICVGLALLPSAIRTVTVAVLPIMALLVLLILPGPLSAHYGVDNGFIGRIILSGGILERFDALTWLGLKTPEFVTSDSGYAYTLGGFGIGGIVFFWAILMLVKGANTRFYLIRDLAGAYFAVLLCISNSPYTIKTGALLWFLVGVLSRMERFQAMARTPSAVAPVRPLSPAAR